MMPRTLSGARRDRGTMLAMLALLAILAFGLGAAPLVAQAPASSAAASSAAHSSSPRALAARTTHAATAPHRQAVDPGPLAAIEVWHRVSADSLAFVLHLPPALDSAIARVAPNFHLRSSREFQYGEAPGEDSLGLRQAHMAIFADFDGDHRVEAVLLGTTGPIRPVESFYEQPIVVLGVRPTATGYDVQVLEQADDFLSVVGGEPPRTGQILSLEHLTAKGRPVAHGRTLWARYQDGDCKGYGRQWTIRRGRWVGMASPCTYE